MLQQGPHSGGEISAQVRRAIDTRKQAFEVARADCSVQGRSEPGFGDDDAAAGGQAVCDQAIHGHKIGIACHRSPDEEQIDAAGGWA